jgi:hypothetical protein
MISTAFPRVFSRRLSPSVKLGIGALPFSIPGSDQVVSVRVVEPIEISNPVWNAMSLVVGIGVGYAVAKVV